MKNSLSVAGYVTTTLLIVNTVSQATGWSERWFALVIAVLVVACSTYMTQKFEGIKTYMTWLGSSILGGFMTFSAAFGVQNAVISSAPKEETVLVTETETVRSHVPMSIDGPSAPVLETRMKLVPKRAVIIDRDKDFVSKW